VRRILLLAAVVACFLSLTALAASLFSAKNGDALVLGATYGGGGIVYATIENQSDKELTLSPEVKLIYYKDRREVPGTGRRPHMTELTIPAGETRRVPIDLRAAYDVEALEEPLPNDFYCLQLTNDSFLPGQRWRCILSFRESEYMPRYNHTNQEVFLHTLPTLRAYFQNYTDDVFQRWADVFEYTALVEEALADGRGALYRAPRPISSSTAGTGISGAAAASLTAITSWWAAMIRNPAARCACFSRMKTTTAHGAAAGTSPSFSSIIMM
jgi:hypothetical protein